MSNMEVLEYPLCDLDKKKNLICDFETLIDSSEMWKRAEEIILRGVSKNIKIRPEDYNQFSRLYYRASELAHIKSFIHSHGIIGRSPEEIWYLRNLIADSFRSLVSVRPGVEEFLKAARETGRTLTMVTESSDKNINFYNAVNKEIRDTFDSFKVFNGGIATCDKVKNITPTPDLFLKALEISNTEAKDSVAITDSLLGVHSAVSAGLQVVAVSTDNSLDSDYISVLVDYQLKGFPELTNKLKNGI